LDEWDSIFGVRTEEADRNKVIQAKKIAKPAYKRITSWRQLRDFRNHFIAHNHRDKKGVNVYLNPQINHSPQSTGEIYLLVFCIKKMMDIQSKL